MHQNHFHSPHMHIYLCRKYHVCHVFAYVHLLHKQHQAIDVVL